MSPDWPWAAGLALAVAPALGHLYHFVLAINIASGLGYRESMMDRVRTGLFIGFGVSSAVFLGMHLHDPWWNWSWPLRSYAWLCLISGVVVWPMTSVALALRRRPEGVTQRSTVLELTSPCGRAELIGTGRRSWLLRLPGNASFHLCLREWEVEFSDLPESLAGLRIVQLSDLHFAPCFERRYFEQVIDACRGWQADLVILTGDVVDEDESIAWIEPLLGRLEARLGKFAILGNHDYEHQPRTIVHELGLAGFETLEGRWTSIDVEGAAVVLGGTSAPWGRALDPRAIPPADFRVLLSHTPDLFCQAQHWEIDLMFSGHNHGGQIRLPLVGAVFMPSRYSRRFDRGFFRRDQTLMYVSEGVAGMHPVRYGCPPEVTQFVLKGGQAATDRPGLQRKAKFARKHEATEPDRVQG
jgi:predicted MPP superfamily phosphohydrolase